jgi:dipeptidyl-peptidase-4
MVLSLNDSSSTPLKPVTPNGVPDRVTICAVAKLPTPPETPATLTVGRIFDSPNLDGEQVSGLKFSPDGKRLTFLKGKEKDRETLDLWQYHLETGKQSLLIDSDILKQGELSEEEAALRERQRLFSKGIVQYTWMSSNNEVFIPAGGEGAICNVSDAEGVTAQVLPLTTGTKNNIKLSPKGAHVTYVHEKNLYVHERATGETRQLTHDGGGTITNGLPDFIAAEEMNRYDGYWWSPDETQIAYAQVDESPVPIAQRQEIYADRIETIDQRYPFAGERNVLVDLCVVDVKTGEEKRVSLGDNPDIYLERVKWLPDSRHLSFQVLQRNHQQLDLIVVDTETLEQRTLVTEHSDTWLNRHEEIRFLKNAPQFVWASERSGFKHLYLYDTDGTCISQLTSGDWCVNKIRHLDEKSGVLYFDGFADSILEQHLYSVPLDGSAKPTKVTAEKGWHDVKVAPDGKTFVDTFSHACAPPQVTLHDISGKQISAIQPNTVTTGHPYSPYLPIHSEPTFGTIKAVDGQTLHYSLLKPKDFDPNKQYPVIVHVYGGPGLRRVRNRWGCASGSWGQLMAQQGFVMFSIDNRGSSDRGVAFESPIHNLLGKVETEDLDSGVTFLKNQPYIDSTKIGLFGWSYGGYMTLMGMSKLPHFAAGVSVAPVSEWGLYDTCYTERYLPADNKEGYAASAVFPYLSELKGRLYLMHGMADDNVLFTNTTKVARALIDHGILFQMMCYPGAKHSIAGKINSTHIYSEITNFFKERLG